MKGSIRFNNDINIEVDVDPSAEEGAKLISAKNLVDGQELSGGGGGGSSDFSTAEVTVINNTNSSIRIESLACIENSEDFSTALEVQPNALQTVDVVLYQNNSSYCYTVAEASIVTTGDIEYDDGDFYITGEGTITFS